MIDPESFITFLLVLTLVIFTGNILCSVMKCQQIGKTITRLRKQMGISIRVGIWLNEKRIILFLIYTLLIFAILGMSSLYGNNLTGEELIQYKRVVVVSVTAAFSGIYKMLFDLVIEWVKISIG